MSDMRDRYRCEIRGRAAPVLLLALFLGVAGAWFLVGFLVGAR